MSDRDELIRQMVEMRVPREKAEREADRLIAEERRKLEPSPFARMIEHPIPPIPNPILSFGPETPEATSGEWTELRNVRRWPFRLTLPWSHLISDNRKYVPALRGAKASIVLTVEYRTAKRLAGVAARAAWGDASTYDGPLMLVARVWFPQQSRKGDAVNFAKCAHDALQGIVYDSDDQLWDARWTRAGVDVDRPRAELTIHPHPEN